HGAVPGLGVEAEGCLSGPPWRRDSTDLMPQLRGFYPEEERLRHFQDMPPPGGGSSILYKVLATAGGRFLKASWSHQGPQKFSDLGAGARLCLSPEEGGSLSGGCVKKEHKLQEPVPLGRIRATRRICSEIFPTLHRVCA
ncbi:hypothetical protein M9458_053833, partial [Cirrhinus mrigala]